MLLKLTDDRFVLCIIELEFDWSCCMKWHETGATHDGMGSPIEATSISPTSADIPGSSVPFHAKVKDNVSL